MISLLRRVKLFAKKRLCAGLLVAVFLLVLLCGCKRSDADAYTVPNDSKRQSASLASYDELLSEVYIPKGYISYYDIAFLGEFCQYQLARVSDDPKRTHEFSYYTIKDASGYTIGISFYSRLHDSRLRKNKDDQPELTSDDLRCWPVELPSNESVDTAFDVFTYTYGNVNYNYERFGEEGKLHSVEWSNGEYDIRVFSAETKVLERDETGKPVNTLIYSLSEYPKDATDTFIGRLLDSDTAQQAVAQLNRIIWWVGVRTVLLQWWPVIALAICGGCAVCCLVIRRRRKKTVAVAEATEEVKE